MSELGLNGGDFLLDIRRRMRFRRHEVLHPTHGYGESLVLHPRLLCNQTRLSLSCDVRIASESIVSSMSCQ